jgi:hypothetical protein
MDIARRFFRMIECEDGTWACRHGRDELDRHDDRDEALKHISRVASERRPARIFLHRLDQAVFTIATLD